MPNCKECGTTQPTSELRKLRKGGYKCKDEWACHDRVMDKKLENEAHPYVHRSYGG